jgi:hypothetical protein
MLLKRTLLHDLLHLFLEMQQSRSGLVVQYKNKQPHHTLNKSGNKCFTPPGIEPWTPRALTEELLQQLILLFIRSLICTGIFSPLQYWFCFRSVLNRMDYFPNCPNNASLQKALEAYNYFLGTTVPEAEECCPNPCQFSLVRPKTYFTMPFIASGCLSTTPLIYNVTLRMPTTILLTESTFSYPFMTFASELGGNTKRDWVYITFYLQKISSAKLVLNTKNSLTKKKCLQFLFFQISSKLFK